MKRSHRTLTMHKRRAMYCQVLPYSSSKVDYQFVRLTLITTRFIENFSLSCTRGRASAVQRAKTKVPPLCPSCVKRFDEGQGLGCTYIVHIHFTRILVIHFSLKLYFFTDLVFFLTALLYLNVGVGVGISMAFVSAIVTDDVVRK